jgi:hypothetical protein
MHRNLEFKFELQQSLYNFETMQETSKTNCKITQSINNRLFIMLNTNNYRITIKIS